MKRQHWPLAGAALVLASLALAGPARAQDGAPPVPRAVPAPGQIFPGAGRPISLVDDFEGNVAVANIQGTGKDGSGNSIQFEVDVRPMQGVYADPGGFLHRGTFVFT
jgi:hypothetical protein